MKQVKLTDERRALFLDELARHGIVIRAARAASPHAAPRSALKTFYHARNRDPDFAEAWDNAVATATSVVESELHRRAVEGYEEPVYQRGEKVGTVRRYSDRLLELRAKALLPHYRERSGDINVTATAQAAAVATIDMEATLRQLDPEGQDALRLVLTQMLEAKGADMDADERTLAARSRHIMVDTERVREYRDQDALRAQQRRALAPDAETRRLPQLVDVSLAPPEPDTADAVESRPGPAQAATWLGGAVVTARTRPGE